MNTRTVEQVTQWESHPFSGGLSGLRELAEREFSGAVQVAGTWAFLLNGRLIGVFDGTLDDLDGGDGTAYFAPDQALPLLFTMQESGGQTQAKYYTNDTPLSEAHETLSNATFSGYVELSENVLSGDYYVVYYGGRSMSAAFVGESERLLTGEEAFHRADDEVGIYEVKKVDLDVIDLSEVLEAHGRDEETTDSTTEIEADPEPETAPESRREDPTELAESTGPDEGAIERDEASPGSKSGTESGDGVDRPPDAGTSQPTEAESTSAAGEPSTRTEESTTTGTDSTATAADSTPTRGKSTAAGASRTDARTTSSSGETTASGTSGSSGSSERAEQSTENVFSEEQQWQEARTIPSLDPGRTRGRSAEATSRRRSRSTSGRRSSASAATESRTADSGRSETDASEAETNASELENALQQHAREIERLRESLSKTKSEQRELLAEREELREEVQRLTSKLDAAQPGDGEAVEAAPARNITAAQAIEGTNLFPRYVSKSDPTLEDARNGAEPGEVNANLSIEHHTQFETSEVAVEGQDFETFLHESIQYRFVEWIVRELLYEIRETGHVGALRELFDAIPKIDRVELDGTATIRKMENGEEVRTQQTFDVIMRDSMGNPLVVANINDARDPATGDMMAELVSAASDVGETNASLAAAVYVTASFFQPEALETASDATGSGLLSREKKESFVRLTRKRGYHLCLVEARGGQFHVNVPEL